MKKLLTGWLALITVVAPAFACTGISLKAKDGSIIFARTIEDSHNDLYSEYVVIPRGQKLFSYTPTGEKGLEFTAKYGVLGLSVVQKEFIAEGINERGLETGLFFFPGYGAYAPYTPDKRKISVGDLQLNQWMLSQFATVNEVIEGLKKVRVVGLEPNSVVHYRIGDASGRQVVLEFVDGKAHFYENTVGVLTNAPGFEWHLTNLNNYINLVPGDAAEQSLNLQALKATGHNSGFLGLPGDATPPSRFVRAAFFCATAPKMETAFECITQAFHLLNNFDIPIGIEIAKGGKTKLPSATQWTSAIDLTNRIVFYKTAYNSNIRCIDLKTIDFENVGYQSFTLDELRAQPIEEIIIF